MKNLKSIVLCCNEVSGKYFYVVKSLKEDSKGKQYIGTDVVEFDKKQDFLPGQEVTIGRSLTSQGTPGPKTLFAKEASKEANFADQYKRINNIKYIMEIEMVTDNEEILRAEYKAQHPNAEQYEIEDVFGDKQNFTSWYTDRLYSYKASVDEIFIEGHLDQDLGQGDTINFSDKEQQKIEKENADFNNITDEIINADGDTPDDVIKAATKSCCTKQYLQKFFVSAVSVIKSSSEYFNTNNSTKSM